MSATNEQLIPSRRNVFVSAVCLFLALGCATAAHAGPVYYEFDLTNTTGQPVTDLETTFIGTGGTITNRSIISGAQGTFAPSQGNQVFIDFTNPLASGGTVAFSFNADFGGVRLNDGTWTVAHVPVGAPIGPTGPKNELTFNPAPAAVSGATITNVDGSFFPIENGIAITGYQVTITTGGAGPFFNDVPWSAGGFINVNFAGPGIVTVFGHTHVTTSAGMAIGFDSQGLLDGKSVVDTGLIFPDAVNNIVWQASSKVMPITGGIQNLAMQNTITFLATGPGETATITSEYNVSAQVPVPGTLFLCVIALGFASLASYVRGRRKSTP